MRGRIGIAMALALALLAAACQRHPPRVDTLEGENLPPLSDVAANDARGAAQLLSGFYEPERSAWRWTAGKFAVILQPPPGAARRGARLVLDLTVPEPVISRRRSIALSASVEGLPLAPQTYTQAGQYTYSREVPGALLAAGPVKIDFVLDRFLAAGEIETRELGLIVRRVALERKRAGSGSGEPNGRPRTSAAPGHRRWLGAPACDTRPRRPPPRIGRWCR